MLKGQLEIKIKKRKEEKRRKEKKEKKKKGTMEFNIPAALWCGIPTHNITCLLTSPDGKSVFTGSDTGEICIWDFHFNVNNN